MRKRPAPEVEARVVRVLLAEAKRRSPEVTEERPVPPPWTERVPDMVGLKTKAPAVLVILRPIVCPLVVWEEVPKVMAPVWAVPPPNCWRERSPVLVTLPFRYVRPEEKVVEAVQVGMPFRRARTLPAVPADVVERAPLPLPYMRDPDWMLDQPVPPLLTLRVPPSVRTPEEVMGPLENDRPVDPPEASTEVTVPSPRDDVAVSVYPPLVLPTRIFPYEGRVDMPVPPYTGESVEVAETAPFTA